MLRHHSEDKKSKETDDYHIVANFSCCLAAAKYFSPRYYCITRPHFGTWRFIRPVESSHVLRAHNEVRRSVIGCSGLTAVKWQQKGETK